MFKKYLIVASKQDKAGMNICSNLSQYNLFNFHLVEGSILNESNLNLDKINQFDFVIFASKHESEKKEKTLSIHCPGNFQEVWGGGKQNSLCPSSALFNKHLFENLNKNIKEHEINYKVTLEATHHGPLINKPSVFIEIGSTEIEWKDRRAGFVIAKTIKDTLKSFKPNPYREIAIGIGGNHYAQGFNKIQEKTNIAISHIIPKYVEIKEDFIKEAINKTIEEVDFVLVDWKGLGNAKEKQRIENLLEKNHIQWKKTSKIKK